MLVKPLLLNMPEDIYENINVISKQNKTPRTKLINEACRYWIENRGKVNKQITEEDFNAPPVFFSSSGTGF